MRLPVAFASLLLFACACSGGTVGDDGDDNNNNNNNNNNTPDAGSMMDMGVATTVECDPDFGQADACGGDLAGTWNYRAACGTSPIADAIRTACGTAEIRVDRIDGGQGTVTVNGGTFDLDVDVDVHVEATIPAACVIGSCPGTQAVLQQALGGSTVTCSQSGTGCDCTVDGPVGSSSSGTVTTNGGIATVNGSDTYYFCVEGRSLTYRRFGTNTEELVFVLDK